MNGKSSSSLSHPSVRWVFRAALFIPALLLLVVALSPQPGWSLSRGTLVLFHANWCASCRDVLPVVKEIAAQNSMTFMQIDVDSQDAPKQARNVGLSIPGEEPPQVYSISRGKASLIFNGKSYRSGGDSDGVRTTILQNLQKVLP